MKLTIKNPAPDDESQKRWGDFHFGRALQRSLASKGVSVFQDFQPNWSRDHEEDVVLVLRGLSKFQPSTATFNILWIISHPAMITSAELDAYDLILTVSSFHCALLREITRTPVEIARHCTDFANFNAAGGSLSEEAETREGIVYVANSRGQRREMAQWINDTDTQVRVFGRAWEKFGIRHLVEKEYLPNSELPALYRSARLCLNDHWKDMRAFGFINNRIFDSLACGLPVLTDSFPEVRMLFGDTLLYARNAEEFRDQIAFCESNYEEILGRVRETWNDIGYLYTFETRADELLSWIENPPRRSPQNQALAATVGQANSNYLTIREFVIQEEEKTAYLEKLISTQTQLADQANRDAAWAKKKREEEKRAKEDEKRAKEAFRRNLEGAERKIKWMTERISAQEQANNQLHQELERVRRELSESKIHLQKEKNIRFDVEARFQKEKNLRISLFNYAERLRYELEMIYKSRSWKIGAPYRMIARAVMGLLRGKKIGKAQIPAWPPSITALDTSTDMPHDPIKTEKRPPETVNQVPTGTLQHPIFADQIYASNTEPGTASLSRRSQMPVYFKFRRSRESIGYQFRHILLPIRRRLSHHKIQTFRKIVSGGGAKKSVKTPRQNFGQPSNHFEKPASGIVGNGVGAPDVSSEAASEIEKSAGYWHDKAMQLLKELEAMQNDGIGRGSLLSKKTSQNNSLCKQETSSAVVERRVDCEGGSHHEENCKYWREQAMQLHEEVEYVKANFTKG